MKLTHISMVSDAIAVKPKEQPASADFKPLGFWYSVDGDWERWCTSDQHDWLEGHWRHTVELGQENILRISCAAEIDSFHRRYSVSSYRVKWNVVANQYDGIQIAPYIGERRLDGETSWYYSWDCASGCIWRPKGLRVFNPQLVEMVEAP